MLGVCMPLTSSAPTATEYIAEVVAESVAAEAAGLDLVMLPEHHQGARVSYAAPLTLAAAILARTDRLRVATGVLALPGQHPVHLAEQVSVLDHLSGGRFVLGVGAGYQEADLEPFGVAVPDRGAVLEETLAALGALLTTESTGADGVHVRFPVTKLRPQPLTRPRPPIWLGSWSRPGIRRAVELADGWIADPIRTVSEVATMAAMYRDAGGTGPVVVLREAWIHSDVDGAAAAFEPLIEPVFSYYRRRGAFTGSFSDLASDRFVLGPPEQSVEQALDIMDRTGASVVALTIRHPTAPDHPRTLEHLDGLGAAWRKARP
jgi:alkanesulfonate monooxygenase SsuD/methylene tetrahydromethanopterin reductase-like flavin-dependent oxidoreductase (luciferase family)